MSKLILSFAIVISSIFCAQSVHCFQELQFENPESAAFNQLQDGRIGKNALLIPNRLGDVSVSHDDSGFTVESSHGSYPIQRCFMDKELRGISKNNLAKLIATGAYLSVNKFDEGNEYSLKLNGRLNGGGLLGASIGFYAGKFIVNFIGHGAILVAGLMTGPAAPATIVALELTFGPVIAVAGTGAAIGCGILGGVATGPV